MPRAFLITHRRYNGTEEFQTSERDYSEESEESEESEVRLGAKYGGERPTSDGASDCGSESSSECPEELYNLTKLAEVSLAAAAGTLIRPRTPKWDNRMVEKYSCEKSMDDKLFHNHRDTNKFVENGDETVELSLRERTRLFFERIENERETPETQNYSGKRGGGTEVGDKIGNNSGSDGGISQRLREINKAQERVCGVISSLEIPASSVCRADENLSKNLASSEGSKSDDSEDHECPDCGKKYSTSSNLARHRQTHRSLGDKKARRCPHCDKIYVSMPAFSMHVRTHNQGCKCHYCGKCFSRPWLLQGHIRTHTGEKPFKCTICNKAFADKSNLRAHVQTHSNTKPHVCGRCGKAFALKSYLYKHEESSCMRAHHRSPTEKNEPCADTAVVITPSNPPPLARVIEPVVTAGSPTSVIVQCSTGTKHHHHHHHPTESSPSASVASSSIIRHTKNHPADRATSRLPFKRHCREKSDDDDDDDDDDVKSSPLHRSSKISPISQILKPTEFLSRMVIRTSVISPNPEHVPRLGGPSGASMNLQKFSPFDFNDSTRNSAFSRPAPISINLAIA